MNWNSFVPDAWKRGTLITLIKRAYLVCSNEIYLEEKLNLLKFAFETRNNFSKWVIFQLLNEARIVSLNSASTTESTTTIDAESYLLAFRWAGYKGNKLIKLMQNNLKELLPENVTTKFAYTGTELSSKFLSTKDRTFKEHRHGIVYYAECPESNYSKNYTGETGHRT